MIPPSPLANGGPIGGPSPNAAQSRPIEVFGVAFGKLPGRTGSANCIPRDNVSCTLQHPRAVTQPALVAFWLRAGRCLDRLRLLFAGPGEFGNVGPLPISPSTRGWARLRIPGQ
jgi:hypothetical protein